MRKCFCNICLRCLHFFCKRLLYERSKHTVKRCHKTGMRLFVVAYCYGFYSSFCIFMHFFCYPLTKRSFSFKLINIGKGVIVREAKQGSSSTNESLPSVL